MNRPIRICRVIARLNVGGPAVHLVHLSAGLEARYPERFTQRLVTGIEAPHEASMVPLARDRGIEPVILPSLGREVAPRDDALALLALYRQFRSWRPDVVETHTAKAGTLGRIAAVAARVPVRIHVFHGHVLRGYFGPRKTRVYLEIERALARLSTRLIALGAAQRRELLDLGIGTRQKLISVPLGFELAPFLDPPPRGALRHELGLSPDTPLVGILGRLAPIKRHDVFIRAAARIAEAKPETRFVIVGDGETQGETKRLAAELKIADRVHFLGWRPHSDLAALLAELDVLANTSDNEGMPVSLIEGMAAGVPVVATAAGGTVSLIEDGISGSLVPIGDWEATADMCITLLDDPGLRARRVVAARATVHPQCDVSTLVETMARLYTSLVRGNR
jgi:glycosyltransferase involved in cell wall biosynthesis